MKVDDFIEGRAHENQPGNADSYRTRWKILDCGVSYSLAEDGICLPCLQNTTTEKVSEAACPSGVYPRIDLLGGKWTT